ncbi:MAG: hypothetical protein CMH22_05600 [Methylophaga sp.]|nr:hypothetical protein [Methylophaga sp.]|tara:strand:+ start:107771 stop:108094 length:324 start_codon:yes stop_codon:yes gene_type:complete
MKELEKYVLDFENDSKEDGQRKIDLWEEAFEVFCSLYQTGYGNIEIDNNLIEIHTGGWSENEELVYLLKKTAWWYKVNVIERGGGHYYLDLKRSWDKDFKHWKIIKV